MREKVLKIMGVFLAVIIGFTVLSRMIDSVNVAKIQTSKTRFTEIDHTIEQEVLVTHNREIPVFTESDLIIQSVNVDVGQKVKKGDVLFTFSKEKLVKKRTEMKREMEKLNLQMTAIKNQKKISEKRYQQAVRFAKNELNRVRESANQAVALAQSDYERAKKDYESYMAGKESEEFDEKMASELKKMMDMARQSYDTTVRERKNGIAVAKENVESASLSDDGDTSLQQYAIDKVILQENLDKIEKLIVSAGQVKSKREGTITQINLTVGEGSPMGAALLMSDNSKGTKAEFLVSEDNLKYMSQNNEVVVSGLNAEGIFEERTDFTIASISPKADMARMYSVVIRMPENSFLTGSAVTVKVIAKSELYDNCIPVNALYSEGEGKYYMYIVGEASGMFGETEVAKKVNVTVLDKNNEYAAIGESVYENVIIETNRDLSNGERVRRIE